MTKKTIAILTTMMVMVCILFANANAESDIVLTLDRHSAENDMQTGEVKAVRNGEVIWQFDTPAVVMTELDTISEVEQNGDSAYIVAGGTLYALDINTGSVKWQYEYAGASNHFAFDNSGNIYFSGYYGPNIVVLDHNGNELYRDDSTDWYWVYDLHIDGDILKITYDNEQIKTLNISQFAKPEISVILNGNALVFDQPPIIENDRTMVPIRAIFEALGYNLEWNGDTQTAVAANGTNTITVSVGVNSIIYSEGTYECDVPPFNRNDRILVPARAISECAGCTVDWDNDTKTVIISK